MSSPSSHSAPTPPRLRTAVIGGLERRPLALVGAGVVLFSTGPVMVAASNTTGPVLSFWRLWIGAVVMGILTVLQIRVSGRRPDRRGWYLTGLCGTAFGIHQLFFMIAIKRTSVVDVTLMQLLAPVFVGVLAAVLFGERPGAAFRVWSLVSIGGAALVVLEGSSGPGGDPVGAGLAIANVVFFALYFTGSKRARSHIETVPFLFGAVAAAGIVVAAYVVVTGAPTASISSSDLAIAATIALVPGSLGHFVTTWQLHRVPANVPPIMQLAVPFLSGSLAWLLLDQGVGVLHVVGGAITLVGVIGALRSPAGRRLAAGTPDPAVVTGD